MEEDEETLKEEETKKIRNQDRARNFTNFRGGDPSAFQSVKYAQPASFTRKYLRLELLLFLQQQWRRYSSLKQVFFAESEPQML